MARITINNRIKSLFGGIFAVQPKNTLVNSLPYSTQGNRYFNLIAFNGEKTPYEMGVAVDIYLDYYSLRKRAWEAYVTSEIIQNTIKKYILWVIGSGLKLDYQPSYEFPDKNSVIEDVETNFRLWAKDRSASYNGEFTLHTLAIEALKNILLAGDGLIVVRLINNQPQIQFIDGCLICTPFDMAQINVAISSGNQIINGVEIDSKGSHVAYYVLKSDYKHERIPAYGKNSKKRMAWLFYGMKHKISDTRGMSLLTAILESVAKLDRYKEATIGAAEDGAKLMATIEHSQHSDGENPFDKTMQQAFGKDKGVAPETYSQDCDGAATKIAQTTEKMVINMPVGATLKKLPVNTDINYASFYDKNSDSAYATMGIPPNVATDKYDSNFSAARAALKSWEYKLYVDRDLLLYEQYYKPIFEWWLDVNSLNGTISIPGYNQALQTNNLMDLMKLRNCRFIGTSVPHIDPLKEVKAEREKLGSLFADYPLTTPQQACENLNTGDCEQNLSKSIKEYENLPDDFKNSKTNIALVLA
jgi:capsid protein